MKKKLITLAAMLLVTIAVLTVPALGTADAASETNLNDKIVYKAVGYKSGDCVLTANVCMIRRAMLERGSTKWDQVTNTSLRPIACISPSSSSLKYSYTYTIDGMSFTVVHGDLEGTAKEKKAQLKKLLKDHPEGVVIRGNKASISWGRVYPHGVLVTSYSDGKFYCSDASHNSGGVNVGIEAFSDSTMRGVGYCTGYWIITKIEGTPKSALKKVKAMIAGVENAKVISITADDSDPDSLLLKWKKSTTGYSVDGYKVYLKDDSGKYVEIADSDVQNCHIDTSELKETNRFKIVGYREVNEETVFTQASYFTYPVPEEGPEEVDDGEDIEEAPASGNNSNLTRKGVTMV